MLVAGPSQEVGIWIEHFSWSNSLLKTVSLFSDPLEMQAKEPLFEYVRSDVEYRVEDAGASPDLKRYRAEFVSNRTYR